ncbi:hypothetical protein F5X99DRAFT_377978 [Biscogniauxia marginata]|nr:hypothetical protein F5X99DRAFT_377978 [Biscogniauxia marginata]
MTTCGTRYQTRMRSSGLNCEAIMPSIWISVDHRPRTRGTTITELHQIEDLKDLDIRALLKISVVEQREQMKAIIRLQTDLNEAQDTLKELKLQQTGLGAREAYFDRLQKYIFSQIDAIRRILGCAPRFVLFNSLPAEIRLKIWDLALPRRIVTMADQPTPSGPGRVITFGRYSCHGPPAVAQVCREARDVALRSGTFQSLQYSLTGRLGAVRLKTRWGWFDPCRDTLVLSTLNYVLMKENCDMMRFTRVTQHVVLVAEGRLGGILDIVFDPVTFPYLRSIAFQMGSFQAQFPINFTADIRAFGLEGELETFVPVEELGRFDQLSGGAASYEFDDFIWNLDGMGGAGGCYRSQSWAWSEYQFALSREWLRRRTDDTREKVPLFRRVVKLFKWPGKKARFWLGDSLSWDNMSRISSFSPLSKETVDDEEKIGSIW